MLKTIQILDWLRLVVCFFVFLGPGYALLSFIFQDTFVRDFKKPSGLVFGFAFSVSFWAVFLLWLKVAHVIAAPLMVFVVCIAGWVVFAVQVWILAKAQKGNLWADWLSLTDILQYMAVLLYFLVYFWSIRSQVVGLGSDSFHHTLIADIMRKNGQIPDSYLPYAPIISFTYHYGYHSFIAVLGWLSNWPVRLLVLVSGPILVNMSGLSAAALVQMVTKNQVAGLISLVVVSFLSIFPVWMLNWGRYPQTLGSILILVFLAVLIIWRQKHFPRRDAVWIAFLAVGLSLTHYRMTILCGISIIAYLFIEQWMDSDLRANLRKALFSWGLAVLLSIILIAPWVIITLVAHQQGVSVSHSSSLDPNYYSIYRLGNVPLNFPTNIYLFAISAIAVVWGIYKRDRFVLWVCLWWFSLYLLSSPHILGTYMDRVTYYTEFFIPAGLLAGWLAAQLLNVRSPQRVIQVGLYLLIGIAIVWGVFLVKNVPDIESAYVRPSDMKAMEWIRASTPVDSLFMVNTYAFPAAKELIIGLDAGYWLPLLADRKTVVPPMSYQTERLYSSDFIHNLVLLHGLNGHLVTSEALQLLRKLGIDYIYVGSQGGIIQVEELLGSSDYTLEYQQDENYIFRLLPKSK